MGAGKSRGAPLPPRTLSELQGHVDVDLTREEIQQWYREYISTAGRYKTRLTQEDFQRVYDSVFVGDSRDFVGHLFRTFDLNNDGYVDFKEFIVGLCVSGSERTDRKLGWAFRMYDTDGSGAISRTEMTSMLKAIYKMISRNNNGCVSDNENNRQNNSNDDIATVEEMVETFFMSADKNGDNQITEDEFIEGTKHMPVFLHLLEWDPDSEKSEEVI